VPTLRVGDLSLQIAEKPLYRFFVLGDTGSGDASQYEVAAAMEARCQQNKGIDGIWLLGDLFYTAGVKDLEDPQWQQKIEIPYGSPCLQKSQIYPVFGNHDYRGNATALIAYSQRNPRWHFPGRFYTVDFGKVIRMVAFDSAFPDLCLSSDTCSIDYARQQVDSSAAAWTVVTAHNPMSSASTLGYSHSGGVFGFFLRQLFCGKADAWFSGHAHHMEHRQVSGCDTSLFVSGGGGGDLYGAAPDAESVFLRSEHGFLEVEVSLYDMTVAFYDIHAKRVYEVKKKRR
jgi:tartrate-resistant acid phosphatase type 5